jgi:hypothetical protein
MCIPPFILFLAFHPLSVSNYEFGVKREMVFVNHRPFKGLR